MTSLTERSRLTADDRCDRCGAQAYVQADLLAGAALLFCGHHARQYQERLSEVAIVIHDETSRLRETRVTAGAVGAAAN